jgi:hypothetical protein
MSAVQVQGNASGTGTLTIAAPNTNTNRTLTLPDNTGTFITTGRAGTILQIVGSTTVGSLGSTSTSYVDTTNATVTITPSSASSKILVMVSGYMGQALVAATNINMFAQLLRGSTVLQDTIGYAQSSAGGLQASTPFSFVYLDSPATTSATTYKVQQRSSTASSTLALNGVWIIVQEIAA